jgi:hypothetical protein
LSAAVDQVHQVLVAVVGQAVLELAQECLSPQELLTQLLLVVVVQQLLMVMVLLLQVEQCLHLMQFRLLVVVVVRLDKMAVVLLMVLLVDQAVVVDITALAGQEILQVCRHPKEIMVEMLLAQRLNTRQAVVAAQVPQAVHIAGQHRAQAGLAQQVQYLALQ